MKLKLSAFLAVLAAIFVGPSKMNAEWSAEYLSLSPKKISKVAEDPAFLKLESQILEHSKNSWCSQDKAKLLLEVVALTKPKICVEIGAFMGASTVPMLAGLQYLNRGQGYIIDAWSNKESIRGLPQNDGNTIWWAGLDMQAIKNHFNHNINHWSLQPFCRVLTMTSEQAVSQIPDIDFLHVDGNFSEEGALRDVELYLSKVVSGGYILLSNVLVTIEGKPTKMKALCLLFDQCDIVCDLDNNNTLLFRKK